jgi:pimeloyl-ACP methyl ester carboxylesterase
MKTVHHLVSNGDGWLLALTQTWDPEKFVTGRRPIVIVPGYGMNSFIFSYHPHGLSLEGALANAGFEVWRADLRGQGASIRRGGSDNFGMADLALTDLTAVVDAIVERTRTLATRVDMIGASLGGSFMFIQATLNPRHRLGSLVAMGSPVRWVKVHPALRILFASPRLAGLIPIRGTRRLAGKALPLISRHVPWLLSIYINPTSTDVSAADELVKTVEDPNRFINRELAEWIGRKDLFIRGQNVSEKLKDLTLPLLCIAAVHDGIVPRPTAEFPYSQIGSTDKQLLAVGDATLAVAHADMFIANAAHERVFNPITDFLARHNELARSAAVP